MKEDVYYEEGDNCPKCNKDILVITQCNETGWNSLKCQGCNYDASEDIKKECGK